MKKCSKCGVEKELSGFFKDKGFSDGHASRCKVCKTVKTMEWREKNKDKYNEYMRIKNKEQYPVDRLRRYGLTVDQHAKMYSEQAGVCAICDKTQEGKRPLAVDHCHESGKVRGLLCYGCNRLMVLLDNPELLARAIAYKAK